MTQVVTELVIDSRAAVAGSQQFESAMAKAQAAAERQTQVTLVTARSQAQLQSSFTRLAASVDPAVKAQLAFERAQRTTDAAVNRGIVSQTEAARVLDLVRVKHTAAAMSTMATSGAVELTGHQITMLTRDLRQMTTMLISGRSPFEVLLTQGMQMTAILGHGTGVRGAVRALGSALLTFVSSPLTLMTVGLAAAAGAASHFFSSTSTGSSEADKHLERHRDLIGSIKDA